MPRTGRKRAATNDRPLVGTRQKHRQILQERTNDKQKQTHGIDIDSSLNNECQTMTNIRKQLVHPNLTKPRDKRADSMAKRSGSNSLINHDPPNKRVHFLNDAHVNYENSFNDESLSDRNENQRRGRTTATTSKDRHFENNPETQPSIPGVSLPLSHASDEGVIILVDETPSPERPSRLYPSLHLRSYRTHSVSDDASKNPAKAAPLLPRNKGNPIAVEGPSPELKYQTTFSIPLTQSFSETQAATKSDHKQSPPVQRDKGNAPSIRYGTPYHITATRPYTLTSQMRVAAKAIPTVSREKRKFKPVETSCSASPSHSKPGAQIPTSMRDATKYIPVMVSKKVMPATAPLHRAAPSPPQQANRQETDTIPRTSSQHQTQQRNGYCPSVAITAARSRSCSPLTFSQHGDSTTLSRQHNVDTQNASEAYQTIKDRAIANKLQPHSLAHQPRNSLTSKTTPLLGDRQLPKTATTHEPSRDLPVLVVSPAHPTSPVDTSAQGLPSETHLSGKTNRPAPRLDINGFPTTPLTYHTAAGPLSSGKIRPLVQTTVPADFKAGPLRPTFRKKPPLKPPANSKLQHPAQVVMTDGTPLSTSFTPHAITATPPWTKSSHILPAQTSWTKPLTDEQLDMTVEEYIEHLAEIKVKLIKAQGQTAIASVWKQVGATMHAITSSKP